MAYHDISGYELSRNWFDWCFENPDIIRPVHTALYFFAIEHCNRLGWKEKFGLPTQMAMDAIGVKNWRTYSSAFEDIVGWGFFKVFERSKNQYSATVVGLVNYTKANTKALSKATQKHIQKQSSSIVVIDKQENKETIEQRTVYTPSKFDIFNDWLKTNYPNVAKMGKQMTEENLNTLISKYGREAVNDILMQMENKKDLAKKYTSVYLTAETWIKRNRK